MTRSSKATRVIAYVLMIGILLGAHLANFWESSRYWAEVSNAGHVAVMGFFSLVVLRWTDAVAGWRLRRRESHYLVAFGATIVIGTLLEIAQIPIHRNADPIDVARDAAGAFAFLLFYAALWDRRIRFGGTSRHALLGPALMVSAVAVLSAAWIPSIRWLQALHHRDRSFPVLATFDSDWEPRFWTVANATLERTAAPDEWADHGGGLVARVSSHPSARAGFSIVNPCPDWSASSNLSLELYLASDAAAEYTVQLEDARFKHGSIERYTVSRLIQPGASTLTIQLDRSALLPDGRAFDFGSVQRAYFYTSDTTRPITVYVDDIRLQ